MCSHDSPIYAISYANKKRHLRYYVTIWNTLKDFLQIQLLLAQSSYSYIYVHVY